MGSHNTAVGAWGEQVAARHLQAAGLVVIDRNWRCDAGEIDLVLRDGATLVVCEVKTRTSEAYGTPHEAVTEQKAARLRELGHRWAGAHLAWSPELRVDLVAVLRPRTGPTRVEHVPGVC